MKQNKNKLRLLLLENDIRLILTILTESIHPKILSF